MTEELAGPLRQLQETARRIGKVSQEAKLDVDIDDYVESFKPHLMDVVYSWSKGASFLQICKMTDVFEGMGFYSFSYFFSNRSFVFWGKD